MLSKLIASSCKTPQHRNSWTNARMRNVHVRLEDTSRRARAQAHDIVHWGALADAPSKPSQGSDFSRVWRHSWFSSCSSIWKVELSLYVFIEATDTFALYVAAQAVLEPCSVNDECTSASCRANLAGNITASTRDIVVSFSVDPDCQQTASIFFGLRDTGGGILFNQSVVNCFSILQQDQLEVTIGPLPDNTEVITFSLSQQTNETTVLTLMVCFSSNRWSVNAYVIYTQLNYPIWETECAWTKYIGCSKCTRVCHKASTHSIGGPLWKHYVQH